MTGVHDLALFVAAYVLYAGARLAASAGGCIRTHAAAARRLTGAVGALFVPLAARLATLKRS